MRLTAMLLLSVLGLTPVFGAKGTDADAKKTVVVTLLPHRQWVQELMGDPAVPVEVLVPPGHNPATYGLLPAQMLALAGARGYLVNGFLPFERRWLPEIRDRFPDLPVADLSRGLELLSIKGHHHEGEEEGDEHGTPHGGSPDPHFWLSPRQVLLQVVLMAEALESWFPERREQIAVNLARLQEKIRGVQLRMRDALAPYRGETLLVFHPSWGYLCQEFGLRQVAIEQEGKAPGGRDLVRIVDDGRRHSVRAVVVQKQFDGRSAQAVARALDAEVLVLDPLAEDWLEGMPRIAVDLAGRSLRK